MKTTLVNQGYAVYRACDTGLVPVAPEEVHTHEDLFAFKPRHFERYPLLNRLLP